MAEKKQKLTKLEISLNFPKRKQDLNIFEILSQAEIDQLKIPVSYEFGENDIVNKIFLSFHSKDGQFFPIFSFKT